MFILVGAYGENENKANILAHLQPFQCKFMPLFGTFWGFNGDIFISSTMRES